jgi:fructose 5-dehydrogenase small subunit
MIICGAPMTDVQDNNESDAYKALTRIRHFRQIRHIEHIRHFELNGSADPASSVSRRRWLTGACAAAAALAFASAGRFSSWGIAPAFADAPAGGGLDAFLALSQHLTARVSFDPVLAKRIYAALVQSDKQFTQNVAALNTWLAGHGGVPSDTVTQALAAEQPPLAKTVTAIMRAWYLGLVGESPHVQVLAYESALMFDPVKDVLTIPSYCRDVPFYWAHKPANT